jgi:hypothetical protein
MTTAERRALPLTAPGRWDVIVAGCSILVEILDGGTPTRASSPSPTSSTVPDRDGQGAGGSVSFMAPSRPTGRSTSKGSGSRNLGPRYHRRARVVEQGDGTLKRLCSSEGGFGSHLRAPNGPYRGLGPAGVIQGTPPRHRSTGPTPRRVTSRRSRGSKTWARLASQPRDANEQLKASDRACGFCGRPARGTNLCLSPSRKRDRGVEKSWRNRGASVNALVMRLDPTNGTRPSFYGLACLGSCTYRPASAIGNRTHGLRRR